MLAVDEHDNVAPTAGLKVRCRLRRPIDSSSSQGVVPDVCAFRDDQVTEPLGETDETGRCRLGTLAVVENSGAGRAECRVGSHEPRAVASSSPQRAPIGSPLRRRFGSPKGPPVGARDRGPGSRGRRRAPRRRRRGLARGPDGVRLVLGRRGAVQAHGRGQGAPRRALCEARRTPQRARVYKRGDRGGQRGEGPEQGGDGGWVGASGAGAGGAREPRNDGRGWNGCVERSAAVELLGRALRAARSPTIEPTRLFRRTWR